MVDSPELSAGDAAQIVGIMLIVFGIFGTVALMPYVQAALFSSIAPWGPVLLGLGITLIMVGVVMNAIQKRRPQLPTAPPSPATPPVTIEKETITCAQPPEPTRKGEIQGVGTVRHLGFESGFWGIVDDNGKNYDIGSLPQEFQVDGLRVRFSINVKHDAISFHMWGQIAELVSIEKSG